VPRYKEGPRQRKLFVRLCRKCPNEAWILGPYCQPCEMDETKKILEMLQRARLKK
jgi:hypothetical protein